MIVRSRRGKGLRGPALTLAVCAVLLAAAPLAEAAREQRSMRENRQQVRDWNEFVKRLEAVHRYLLGAHTVRTVEETGGYAGLPDFYREVSYVDEASGRVLSRIQWERARPKTIHAIDIFLYDGKGRLAREYSARFLPRHRNAPIQTLVNFHHHEQDLHAFRQFDASGDRIYERCKGSWFNEQVDIEVIEPLFGTRPSLLASEAYTACFGYLPVTAEDALDPRNAFAALQEETGDADDARGRVQALSRKLRLMPERADLYAKRGHAYFEMLEFTKAIDDFNRAILLDDTLDDAWFGRGMALGRAGRVEDGIRDLSVYIERHPDSSLAYTKRGVRHIWNRDFEAAEKDLRKAIQLDSANAEAHDDLGAVLARRGDHGGAIRHLREAILHDPSYQKAHHNLALVYQMLGRHEEALTAVDGALRLGDGARSTLLLKSAILKSLGRLQEAARFEREASFLPADNWSEQLSLDAR